MGVNPQEQSDFVKPLFKKRRRRWLYGGIAIVVVLGAGVPIALAKLHSGASLSPGQLYTVGYGNVTQNVSTSGTIEAPTEVDLNFQGSHSGLIKTISVKVGQTVKKGQVLAKIDDSNELIQVLQAQASLKQSQASLTAAQAKLEQDQAGATPQLLATDKLAIEKAQTALSQAQQSYQNEQASYNDRSTQAASVQSAQDAVTKAQQAMNTSDGTITKDNQNLANDQTQLKKDEQTLQDTISQYGTVTEQQVQTAYQAYQHEEGMVNEWNNGTFAGSNPYTTAASDANNQYNQLNTAYTNVQTAKTTVTNDQNAVQSDQTTLTNDQTSETQTQQQNQLALTEAQQNLQQAQQQYNDRTSAQQSLDSAKNSVTNAQENLQSAQLTLKNDEQPTSDATIKSDESGVTSAESSVQNAEANLQSAQNSESETVLKAPIDGVVTQLNGKVGDSTTQATGTSSTSATGSTGFIVMDDANTKDMQVNLAVSESQIGSVQSGQSITLTVPAYPKQTFNGTITQVYPVPTVSSNVTQYTVIANVDNSSGKLRPGMSASVNITTAQKNHVVTVPAIALHQMGTIEGVYVEGEGGSSGSANATGANASGKGNSSGGTSGNKGQSGKSSSASGKGGSSQRGSYGGGASYKGKSSSGLPAGVRFQPVQEGLIGLSTVEITSGLQAGDKILLTLPGQTASAIVASQSSGFGGHGGGFGGRG